MNAKQTAGMDVDNATIMRVTTNASDVLYRQMSPHSLSCRLVVDLCCNAQLPHTELYAAKAAEGGCVCLMLVE